MVTRVLLLDPARPNPDAIREAAEVIKTGGLVAFPTDTVYGLGAHLRDEAAMRRLFTAKGRPEGKPLIVHVCRVEQVFSVARQLPPKAHVLMRHFFPGPLTLVLPRHPQVSDVVTAGGDTVAVRMPAHPVALALIEAVGDPIVAPSANLSGARSATSAQQVLEDLEGRIEMVLDAGPAPLGQPSTVLDLTVEPPRILRAGALSAEALRAHVPIVEADQEPIGQE